MQIAQFLTILFLASVSCLDVEFDSGFSVKLSIVTESDIEYLKVSMILKNYDTSFFRSELDGVYLSFGFGRGMLNNPLLICTFVPDTNNNQFSCDEAYLTGFRAPTDYFPNKLVDVTTDEADVENGNFIVTFMRQTDGDAIYPGDDRAYTFVPETDVDVIWAFGKFLGDAV